MSGKNIEKDDPFQAIIEQLKEYDEGTELVSPVHEYSCFCGKEKEDHWKNENSNNNKE
ncbi:hypothetical protein HYV79_01585 [Candidatus Woesearchaeota archaeon]|nr:hypothetical protein [Candidatus Woesearchaeota archaeon]